MQSYFIVVFFHFGAMNIIFLNFSAAPVMNVLFAEEAGLVLEVKKDNIDEVTAVFKDDDIKFMILGKSSALLPGAESQVFFCNVIRILVY